MPVKQNARLLSTLLTSKYYPSRLLIAVNGKRVLTGLELRHMPQIYILTLEDFCIY
jgi:hypothetical protein